MALSIPKRFFCLFFTTAVLLSACHVFDRSEERVVIAVGNRQITKEELHGDIQQMVFEMGIKDRDVKNSIMPIIDKIVEKSLIMEYGKEEGIAITEDELESAISDIKRDYPEDAFKKTLLQRYIDFGEWKESLREDLLIKKIITNAASTISPITFNETKAYFESHRNDFKRPRSVRLRQIVTRTREEAENILERFKEGHEMAELAKQYSITPEAENYGMLGWIAKGELEESMDEIIFSMPVGEISNIVGSPYGYHIFQVLSIRDEGLKELPEVMAEIESKLTFQKRELFYVKWIDELRARFPVWIEKDIYKEWSMEG